jgi:hypothetical protein
MSDARRRDQVCWRRCRPRHGRRRRGRFRRRRRGSLWPSRGRRRLCRRFRRRRRGSLWRGRGLWRSRRTASARGEADGAASLITTRRCGRLHLLVRLLGDADPPAAGQQQAHSQRDQQHHRDGDGDPDHARHQTILASVGSGEQRWSAHARCKPTSGVLIRIFHQPRHKAYLTHLEHKSRRGRSGSRISAISSGFSSGIAGTCRRALASCATSQPAAHSTMSPTSQLTARRRLGSQVEGRHLRPPQGRDRPRPSR